MPASTGAPAWQPPPPSPFQTPQQQWTPQPSHAVESAGRTALIWSLIGFFTGCFPLNIAGLVTSIRARTLAREAKVSVPGTATVGLVLSAVTTVGWGLMIIGFAIWFAFDQAALSDRVAELNASIPQHDREESLSHQTACDLAELRVRTDGWKDADPIVIDGFTCPGRVNQEGDEAELTDYSFNASSSIGRQTVTVCYKRGERWMVKSFREEGGCWPE
jgi:hypothetical protein